MNQISGSKRWIALLVLLLALASLGWVSVRVAAAGQPTFLPRVQKDYNPAATHDCASIQQAIDNLPDEGGIVIISGTYLCQTAIVIDRDNVELRGEGASTLLQLAAGANSPVLVIGSASTPPAATRRNIQVSNLTIDGNWRQQAWECWGGACDSGGLTFIRNNAITVRGAEDILIEAVRVHSARSGGLVTERVVRRLTVRDFTSYDNYFDGLAAYQTEDSLFSGLYLHDNPYAGMSLDIGFNRNIVSDAVLANNGKQGVFMRDSRDNLFEGLQIRNSGEQGLFLAQVDQDASKPAAGNTFSGLVVSNSVQAGLRVNDASCTHNLVVAAQFIGNGSCISETVQGMLTTAGVLCR